MALKKVAISNFKGISAKFANELMPNHFQEDLVNFDFIRPGALNKRRGLDTLLTGFGIIKGLSRMYGKDDLRQTVLANTEDFHDISFKLLAPPTAAPVVGSVLGPPFWNSSVGPYQIGIHFIYPEGISERGPIAYFDGSQVANEKPDLTAIPLGPFGCTGRVIVSTLGGGSDFFEVGRINDNVTTIFAVTVDDSTLSVPVKVGPKTLLNTYNKGLASTVDATPNVTINYSAVSQSTEFLKASAFTGINTQAPAHAYLSNDVYAIVRQDKTLPTGRLTSYNFKPDIFIPPASTILGFEIRIEGKKLTADVLSVSSFRLKKADGTLATDNVVAFTQTDTTFTFGGAADLFGLGWTRDEVVAPAFGLQYQYVDLAGAVDQKVLIDQVLMKIYYAAPAAQTPVLPQNVAAGDLFQIDSNGIEYEILSVNTNTTLTLTTNFVGTFTGQLYTIRRKKNNNDFVSFANAQNINRIFMANGVDPAMEWNGLDDQLSNIGLPVPSALIAAAGAVGVLTNGTYQYKVTFLSELDESNPSAATSITIVTGPDQVNLSSIALGPSKTIARKIYRTTNGGSNFFFAAQINNNEATTAIDNVSDATLVANALLHDGNNFQPGALGKVEWHQNRLFGILGEKIVFSKLAQPGHFPAANFFKALNGDVPLQIKSLGDFLVIYTASSVSVLLGDSEETFTVQGYDNGLGLSSPFSVYNTVGGGQIFFSHDGLYFFTGRAAQKISEPIERLLFDPDSKYRVNRTRMVQAFGIYHENKYYLSYPKTDSDSNDIVLVYDFGTQDWFLYDIQANAGCVYYGEDDSNEFIIGNNDGAVKQMLVGFSDEGVDVQSRFRTKYMDFGIHEIKRFTNVYLKFISSGNVAGLLTILTDNQQSELNEHQFELANQSHGQEILIELPSDFRAKEIQVKLTLTGQAQCRLERMIFEYEVEPSYENEQAG